jgi:hypothetical protein|tara:strand:+ start:2339 stop:2941 length:603 start_codon:yes stop_codon:yes gene_type:complete
MLCNVTVDLTQYVIGHTDKFDPGVYPNWDITHYNWANWSKLAALNSTENTLDWLNWSDPDALTEAAVPNVTDSEVVDFIVNTIEKEYGTMRRPLTKDDLKTVQLYNMKSSTLHVDDNVFWMYVDTDPIASHHAGLVLVGDPVCTDTGPGHAEPGDLDIEEASIQKLNSTVLIAIGLVFIFTVCCYYCSSKKRRKRQFEST